MLLPGDGPTSSNPLWLKWGVDETSTLLPIPTGDSKQYQRYCCAPGGKGRHQQDVKLLQLKLVSMHDVKLQVPADSTDGRLPAGYGCG